MLYLDIAEKQPIDNGEAWVARFDSAHALLTAVNDPAMRAKAKAKGIWSDMRTNERMQDARWSGMDRAFTWDKLEALINDGWSDGAAKVQALAVDVPPAKSVRRRIRWGAEGDAVDQQRVWGGQLDKAWSKARRTSVNAPTVKTIYADITATRNVDAAELFWRGAAVLCLSDLLQAAGYNVEIIAASCSEASYDNVASATFVTVKSALAPLELNTLAATLCCAAFNRGLVFSWRALNSAARLCGSVGESVTARHMGLLPDGAIDGVSKCRSQATAEQWVRDTLAKIEGGERE